MATLIESPVTEPRIDWRDIKGSRARLDAWASQVGEAGRRWTGKSDEAIGRIVRFQIADGYAEYVVFDTKPLQLVHVPESYDISAAYMRGLALADIRAQVDYDKRLESSRDEHEEFYANLPIGAIVHYDNGFCQFIRCERVQGPKGKRLRPLALIGNWHSFDLPRREVDGSVRLGHQVEWINEGRRFEPHYTSIWERLDAKGREWSMRGLTSPDNPPAHLNEIGRARYAELRYQAPFDPTKEEPIDLSVPPMTAEQERVAELVRKVAYIHHLTAERPSEDTAEAYEAILDRVREEVV